MITKPMLQKEVDVLRGRVRQLENQLAPQAQTVSALRENEARLQSVLNNLMDAPYRRNLRAGCYDYLSPVIEQLTGWTVEEMNQADIETVLARIYPDDLPQVQQEIERTNSLCQATGRATGELEYRFRTKAGDYCWLGDYLTVVAGEDGQPLYRFGVVRDISAGKQVEDKLLYQANLLQNVSDAIITTDPVFKITSWNQAAETIYGWQAAEVIGQPITDLLQTTYAVETQEEVLQQFLTQGIWQGEAIQTRKNGLKIIVLASVSLLRDSTGQPVGAVAVNRDITERKQAEAALRASEERFRLFMDNSPTLVWVKDTQGRCVYLNQTHEKRLGVRLEEWLGKTNFEIWPPEVAEQVWQNDQKVLAADHLFEFTEAIPNPDGSLGTWWTFKFPFQDASGQRYIAGIGLDISERQKIEEALHLTRFSVERAADAIYWVNETGRIIDVNEAACRMLGYSREELLQRSAYDIDPAGSSEAWRVVWQRLKQAQTLILERTHQARDGRIIPVEVVANYMEFGGRAFNCTFVRDISERRATEEARARLEEQLHQAQKMESIGRLAGGVAHDFNNLLTVILGYSELMQVRLPLEDRAREQLEQIRQSAKRAEGLTRQLLAFSRKQMLVPVVLDLNELITNLRKMLKRLIGEDIALTTTLQPDLWWVKVDPGQIEQVIMNLVVNARDAMPTGGRLTLETVNVTLKDRLLQTHSETLSGPSVRLTVTDTGHGMDKATQAQIFEPFFTTKEQGKGTGLGLATVYGIIKQSEGEITVDSQPGQGTTFTLYLPAHDTVLTGSVVPQPEPVAQPGHETILLVEDEQGVRDLVRVALRNYGYILLEADHGYQALAMAKQQAEPIDLLLTDVVMPDINGLELAERLKALHPQIKVLFMSGYTDDEVLRRGVQMAEAEFMAKPFSPVALAAKVRAILDK